MTLAALGVAAGVGARAYFRKRQERELTGDVVLITGGSRGLGLALARQFAKEGSKVAICARDDQELKRAADNLQCFAVTCDVSDKASVESTIDRVRNHFGRIDILVNNAGEIQVGPVQNVELKDFEDAMNVMFWGTVYPTMTLLPEFLQRRSGHIVNITSIGGKVGIPHLLPYGAAKYAATGFSEGLRSELNGSGVLVTTIAPGLMRTGSYNAAKFKGDQAAESSWFSLGGNLPGMSMDGKRAARQIVAAVKRGDSEKILTTPASVLARVHSVAPGLTQDLLGLAARTLLPKAGPASEARPGWSLPNLRSPKMRVLLALGRLAARQLNQRTA